MVIVGEKKGDLIKNALDGKYDAIVHGCNCFCKMGAGIAKQIKITFPEAYEIDKKTKSGDKKKLGTYTQAEYILENKNNVTIINAYTQYSYNPSIKPVDYEALRTVFTTINNDFKHKVIGIPKIGAGLAGGNWEHIFY